IGCGTDPSLRYGALGGGAHHLFLGHRPTVPASVHRGPLRPGGGLGGGLPVHRGGGTPCGGLPGGIVGPAPDGIAPAGGLVALGQSVVPAGRGTSHPVVLPYGDPVVVSVDTGPSDRAIVTVFPTDLHIGPPRVVPVGDIVGVAHRTVVPPIGGGVHDTVGNGGPDKVPVEGPVHIMPVVYVDKS